MKAKIISIITIATLLFVSIMPTAIFASDRTNNSATTIQTNIIDENDSQIVGEVQEENESDLNNDQAKQDENSQNMEQNAGADNQIREGTQENEGITNSDQIREGTLNDVADTLNNGGNISPDKVITSLQEKNISIDDMIRAMNQISENAEGKYKELSDDELASYADVLNGKIEKERVQNLNNSLEQLSELYCKAGQLEKAIEIQKRAIKANCKDVEAYKKLGEELNKKGEKGIKVFSNGEQVKFDVQPLTKEGHTLVPISAIAVSLKAQVKWNPVDKTILLSKDGAKIKLTLGKNTAYVNDKEVKLDAKAESVNGRTMVPVRFISEAFNSTVKWEPVYQSVVIY